MDLEQGAGLAKNRKRGSKIIDDREQTPFTSPHKTRVKSQEANLKKRKTPNCLRNTKCYFCEFCDNTSIHGFKFLGQRGRYFIETMWWFAVVVGAICGSAYFIRKTYDKWITSPVVVTFATTETPIWKIPFPAVTICPEMKINKTFLNYTDIYLKHRNEINTTKEEDQYFHLFSMVCDYYEMEDDNETALIDEDILDKFYDGFANMELETCKWLKDEFECDDIFSYTITSEGWCRTFNMLDLTDIYVNVDEELENRTLKNTNAKMWSLEGGYPAGASLDAYPRRTFLAGLKAGLEIDILVEDEELDYVCTELQGFKVTLHHPAEDPDMDRHFRVPLNQAVVVGIRPRMIGTAEEIRAYSPEKRECYLPHEKPLSTFQIYTQQNCMTECFANYTAQECGCIPFYMSHHSVGDRCGPGSRLCIEQAKVMFLSNDVLSKIDKSEMDDAPQCGCLPACTTLEFDTETSQTDWEWRKSLAHAFDIAELNDLLTVAHRSRLIVYYKEMQFMTSERHELYGVVDFLASCGGLLGLFCGFSCTSSIEILYYLTLRFLCNMKKFGRRVWSGAPELIEEEENEKERNEFI